MTRDRFEHTNNQRRPGIELVAATRLPCVAVTLWLASMAAIAQSTNELQAFDIRTPRTRVNDGQRCNLMAILPQTRQLELSPDLDRTLAAAGECMAANDARCATTALSQLDADSLSNDERVLLRSTQADVIVAGGDAIEGSALYASALEAAESPIVRTTIAGKYARTLLNRRNPAAALRVLSEQFACESWTADALATRAIAYQWILVPELASENLDASLRLYRLSARDEPEGLQALREQIDQALEQQRSMSHQTGPNTDPTPVYKPGPVYPSEAASRALGGCVRVAFTVTENGSVEDGRIVEASHALFQQPALDAVTDWRYRPALRDGIPVRREGHQTTLSWELEGYPRARFEKCHDTTPAE